MASERRWVVLVAAAWLVGCRSEPEGTYRGPEAVVPPGGGVQESGAETRPAPPASQDERMAWWREARFGMFIHWGLYAIPAGKWGDRTGHGEWIRETAQIPLEEYERFLPQFNPVQFDADAWARMAADAGMKYLVITSKHHDGFALYDSALSDWDVGATPFGRDILGELKAACDRHGVRFATYHSIMDWHHPDYLPRRGWETRSTDGADFERFREYLHGQVAEIAQRYHPAVMWFDGEWESTWSHEYGVELFKLCRELDPWMLVNNRVDVHRGGMGGFSQSDEAVGDFGTPEQEIPATGMAGVDWETCMTMNDHWGFNAADTNWKSSRDCIRMLVDVASKGGNYLLNVGPRADGTFPPEAIERLAAIGAWMKKHASAIHGTSASPFESLEWGRVTYRRDGDDTVLFLHVFERPKSGEIVLPGLGNDPLSAGFLAGPRQLLGVRRKGADLAVELPENLPDADCTVVTLRVAGAPVVYRAPELRAEASEFVTSLAVSVANASSGLELRYTLDGSEPGPASTLWNEALTLDATTTVRVRGFHKERGVTSLVERTFTRVAPRAAVDASGAAPGLRCQTYTGNWDALPDFAALEPRDTSVANSIGPAPREEHVGVRYSGLLTVPADELYVFALASDDGSRLWIDGELVVDNDGLHGTVEKRGTIPLATGAHALRVEWINKTGGAELSLRMAAVGKSPAPVPESAFSHLP